MVLSCLHTLYTYFIEGDTIFVGKRKTYAKRVESERIRVDSKSTPPKYSTLLSGKATTASAPTYHISMSYVRLTNSGKTVIHKVSERARKCEKSVINVASRELNVQNNHMPPFSIARAVWTSPSLRGGSPRSWRALWVSRMTVPVMDLLHNRRVKADIPSGLGQS